MNLAEWVHLGWIIFLSAAANDALARQNWGWLLVYASVGLLDAMLLNRSVKRRTKGIEE